MTEPQLQQLNELMATCRTLLVQVRSGNLADFDSFGDKFDRDYGRLTLIPTDTMNGESRKLFQRRLRELERIRIQLFKELADQRGELVRRLTGITKGQQGLDAYKSTVTGVQKGVHRAEG